MRPSRSLSPYTVVTYRPQLPTQVCEHALTIDPLTGMLTLTLANGQTVTVTAPPSGEEHVIILIPRLPAA